MNDAFAVVLGLSPTGLYAVRELGEAGVRVLGVESRPLAGRWSKYLTVSPGCLTDPDEEKTVERLLAVAEREGARGVLIPASDAYIEFVVRHAARLSARYDFQASYSREAYGAILDKGLFTDLCRAHGVAAPGFWKCAASGLESMAEQVVYPCLIKPTLIHVVKDFMAGRKVFIVKDAAEFRRVARLVAGCPGDWLVQEIVPGPESNITVFIAYFAKDGSVRQAFTGRKLRQFPPGFGSASLVRGETLSETRKLSEAFLTAAGFRGIGGIEYKYDERDGKLKIIEVNARPELWCALAHHSGKHVVLAAFNDLTGRRPLPESEQIDGVVWRYWLKDLCSALFYAVKGRDFILAQPTVDGPTGPKRVVGPLFDMADPMPLLGEPFNYALKLVSRVFR